MTSTVSHESSNSFLDTPEGAGKQLLLLSKSAIDSHSESVAQMCRVWGIKVGDSIVGTENYGADWNQARLTLLWLGERAAVWSEVERTSRAPEWTPAYETADWALECRPWYKVVDCSPVSASDLAPAK